MHIFCDFDGTISDRDSTDLVLSRLAAPSWRTIERHWEEGRIDAACCMRRQIALIDATLAEIDAVLDEVELTPGFTDFVAWTRQAGVPLTIVSDGVDYFIGRILTRHGVKSVPVFANRLVPDKRGFRLMQPHRRAACEGGSGVCKCAIVNAVARRAPIVFIGDGRSDFCVSTHPDLLFATGRLEEHCTRRGVEHVPFVDFHDVRLALARIRAPSRASLAA